MDFNTKVWDNLPTNLKIQPMQLGSISLKVRPINNSFHCNPNYADYTDWTVVTTVTKDSIVSAITIISYDFIFIKRL